MSEKIIDELFALDSLSVALESSSGIPSDAQQIMTILMGNTSGVSNEAEYDNGGPGAISKLATRAKELVKKLITWIMERFTELKTWAKTYMLAVEKTEEELTAAEDLLRSRPVFKSGKIVLLPTVTGALAVEGRLDETFADKLSYLRHILETLIGIRSDVEDISGSVIKMINKYIGDEQEGEDGSSQDRNAIIEKYKRIAAPLEKILTQPDPSKTLSGKNRASHRNLIRGPYEKIQDVTSVPLPGGYAMTSTIIKDIDRVIFGNVTTKDSNIIQTMGELLDNLSPNLVKVYSAGITFSGTPLNERKCHQIIEEGKGIISLIKNNPEKAVNIEKELVGYKDLIKAIDRDEKGTNKLYSISLMLRASVKLLESDRFETYRYATRTVRASLRYVSASIEKSPKMENPNLPRLGVPA